MGFVYLILLLLLLLAVKVFTQTLKFRFLFDLNGDGISINIFCLYPLIKILIEIENNEQFLIFYLFRIRVYKKQLKIKKHAKNRISLIKSANPTHINVTTLYGFKDPFTTGVVCGALNIISRFINIDQMNQSPNFVSDNDYIHVDATADINVWHSIVNFAKSKKIAFGN